MTRTFYLIAGSLLILAVATMPAAADFYFHLRDGRYLVIPDALMLILLLALVAFAATIYAALESNNNQPSADDLPVELNTLEPPEFYDDQAARARALKRKLDAEIELVKSYILAARTQAELDELSEIIDLDKAKPAVKR